MSINLKPIDQRNISAADVIRRLKSKRDRCKESSCSWSRCRTSPWMTVSAARNTSTRLKIPTPNELNDWTDRFVDRLKQLPELEDVATDQQTGGLAVYLVIDRVTASRLGIAPSTIDNTLYDAFGQRQINTMYTQVNQYHVILESEPQFQKDPDKLNHLYIQSNASSGATGAASLISFASSGSSSAGSNALTGSALYTPSANTLAPPANALIGSSFHDDVQQRRHLCGRHQLGT